MTPHDRTANGRFRVLAVATEAAEGEALHQLVVETVGDLPTDVLVVVPAPATEADVERLVTAFHTDGIPSYGWVGDADTKRAIADALDVFPADMLVAA